jgi:predicted nuclease of predicted toxin-antitoxin system
VRILVDANLSPRVAEVLGKAGYDATHVRDCGLLRAGDEQILVHAQLDGAVILSADTDFTAMLALRGLSSPSLLLLRSADHLTPDRQAELLLANLASVTAELEAGAVVTIARGRLRVRTLPIGGGSAQRGESR